VILDNELHPIFVLVFAYLLYEDNAGWKFGWNKVVARSYNYHSHNLRKYSSHHLQYSLKKCCNKEWTNLLNKLKMPQEVTMV
jgi:hypothetical protein